MSQTPNVVVQNPTVRKVANWVLGVALIVLPAAAVLDANSSLDFSEWLVPATAVTSFLAGVFAISVTAPNVPKPEGEPSQAPFGVGAPKHGE